MSLLDKIKDVFDGDNNKKHEEEHTDVQNTDVPELQPEIIEPANTDTPVTTGTTDTIVETHVEPAPVEVPVEAPHAEAPAPAPAPAAPVHQTYTVVEGDTLWGISEQFLGDGSRYQEIADFNGISNPDLINVGQVITIP